MLSVGLVTFSVGQNFDGIPLRTFKLLYACVYFLHRFVLDRLPNYAAVIGNQGYFKTRVVTFPCNCDKSE